MNTPKQLLTRALTALFPGMDLNLEDVVIIPTLKNGKYLQGAWIHNTDDGVFVIDTLRNSGLCAYCESLCTLVYKCDLCNDLVCHTCYTSLICQNDICDDFVCNCTRESRCGLCNILLCAVHKDSHLCSGEGKIE